MERINGKFLKLVMAVVLLTMYGISSNRFSPNVEAQEKMAYKNPTLPINDRVKDLLGRMTLEEKIAQMQCLWKWQNKKCRTEWANSPASANF
jgi:hypothetical protein